MRNLLHALALMLAGATAPRHRGTYGVLIRLANGRTVTYSGMDEWAAKSLVEVYNYSHDGRVVGTKLILP